MRKLALTLLALVAAVPLHAQERWDLTSARVTVRFNAGLVRDLGIRLAPAPTRTVAKPILAPLE